MKLAYIQENYLSKPKFLEDHYLKKFDQLRLENSQLRSRLMEKVTEITKYNTTLDRLHSKGRFDLKFRLKSVLEARANAQLILIPESFGQAKETANERPLSAPGTDYEKHQVQLSALSRKKEELM